MTKFRVASNRQNSSKTNENGALVQLSRSKHFLLVTKIFTIKSTKKQGYRHLRPGKDIFTKNK